MSTPLPALGNRTPEQLKVAELREELKKRGIQIKGLKKDLVDRLEEVLKQEELDQQKELDTIVEDAAPTPLDVDKPDLVPPVTKRRSKGHDHNAKEEEPKVDAVADEPVLASEGTEIIVSVAEESKPEEVDPVPVPEAAAEIVTAATPTEETTVAAAIGDVVAAIDEIVEGVPAVESAKVVDESATTTTAVPALEDLVADLEQNFNQVVQEEPPVQQVEETGAVEGQTLPELPTDIIPVVEKAVTENMAVTEEIVSTTFEKTTTTTVEEQEVQVVSGDQNVVTLEAEQIVTTSTRVELETMMDSANKVASMEETTTTVVTVETRTTVDEAEGEKLNAEAVGVLEGKSDEKIGEILKEDVPEVVTVAETPKDAEVVTVAERAKDAEVVTVTETAKDETAMDVDGGAEKGLNVEEPKDETPMDVVGGAEKGLNVEEPKDETAMDVVGGAVKGLNVEEPKDETPMDVVGGAEKGLNVEEPKDETPMDVVGGAVKGLNVEEPKDETPMDVVGGAEKGLNVEEPKDETAMDVVGGAVKGLNVEEPKDETPMDVVGGAVKGLNVEEPKDETPMDVDADIQKGSKRKDAVDGEFTTLEPTKRRRWNSAKGEEDSKSSGKDVQPLELQETVPSPNAPIPSAKVLTPKSAPSEKVAVTRNIPTRTEATVNGEGQKTRVVPPSAKPATSSLKIDKFLRPFTFKAVKELLAQTGSVQDVWMDQIKTHCFVTYSSVEEATATRNALYNLQWPPQGGRLLTAEFVDPSEVKVRSDGEKAAAAAGPTAAAAPSTNAITPRGGALAANSKAQKEGGTVPSSGQPSTPAAGLLPPPPPLPFSPRDKPKQEVEKTPTLDDLFRKTRSKPHIYYLPLTAQEVADKVAARNREAATKPGVKA